jgi:hypothetical protein
MPKIIGVDCDETLSDTLQQVLKNPFLSSQGTTKQDITFIELSEIPKL